MAGVATSVSTVAKVSPNTMAWDRGFQNSAISPLATTVRDIRSIDRPKASGSKPNTVVIVVSNTGRRRWEVARTITALISSCGCELRTWLKVSIRMMLLLTTMPASATTPTPVSKVLNGFPSTSKPSSTPAVDITTASRIRVLW